MIARMIKKDLKKWARLCYQGNNTIYNNFYKCKLVATTLNQLFKMGKINKDTFKKLLLRIEDLNRNTTYTEYETKFMLVYSEWWNLHCR